MILPIYLYGQPVLKKQGKEVPEDYPGLKELIENMYETMYNAQGVGLAAPQVGLSLRLFVVDTIQTTDESEEKSRGIKKVFINPRIIEESGENREFEEGCLSIPDLRGDVMRLDTIKIAYFDEDFKEHVESYQGINARVIQHEYDHVEGQLFTEKLKPIKKRMIQRKLDKIKTGQLVPEYRYFPNK